MAAKAYVLIETNVGKTDEVVKAIRNMKGVVSVYSVSGPYDVIAIVEGKSLTEIGETVTGKFHPVDGISRTVTCLSIES